jgi:hypothetical protein
MKHCVLLILLVFALLQVPLIESYGANFGGTDALRYG